MAVPAAAAWTAALVGVHLSSWHDLLLGGALGLLAVVLWRRRWVVAGLLPAGAVLVVAALRLGTVTAGPVDEWAADRATVHADASVSSDARLIDGPFGDRVVVRLLVHRVTARGATLRVRAPVLAIAGPDWRVADGQRIRVQGRLGSSDTGNLSAILIARGPPLILAQPSLLDRAVNRLRSGLRESVRGPGTAARALVPALVVGDDAAMGDDLEADFRATGLTHLTAVSGANLTLLLAFVLPVARVLGVRAHGLAVAGLGTVAFFVLLARPDPSVLRAAAMGVVAIAGLGAGGSRRGLRALAVATTALLLLDPWLGSSVGFALSVVATAAIVLIAPHWRDAMGRWLPRWLAEAIAVPAAAQLACTPLILAISGQVSLVAVLANLAAAPAVGPATVLGLCAALASPVSAVVAQGFGWGAGLAAWWIVQVGRVGADLPGAAVAWPSTPPGIALVAVLCLGAALAGPRLLAAPRRGIACAAALGVLVLRPFGGVGWPPQDWLFAMCDVGQGDALVLNAGGGAAVVVDTGPDPQLLDTCLDGLEVRTVPMVVLTHLHADHAGGLSGVFDHRSVGGLTLGPSTTPPKSYAAVLATAARHRVPVRVARQGERAGVGPLRWQVLGPPSPAGAVAGRGSADPTEGVESATENNASLVLRVRTRGVSLLLTGDIEPEAQQALLGTGADLDVDVLKVPHHGSSHQDARFLAATSPALALVSVGADNDYGHPSPVTLDVLDGLGARVLRTDLRGTVAVQRSPAGLAFRTHEGTRRPSTAGGG